MLDTRERKFTAALLRLSPFMHRRFTFVLRYYGTDLALRPEDIIQETAVDAYRNFCLPQYEGYSEERLILEKMMNKVSECVQAAKRRKAATVSLEKASTRPLSDPYRSFLTQDLLNYLYKHTEPVTWQICFFIKEGLTYKEIAHVLSLTVGTVKMRISRLRKELKALDLRPD